MDGLRRRHWLPVCIVVGLVAGCGGEKFENRPANVAGEYNVSLTNGENSCELQDWQQGASTTGIPVTVMQDGSDATAIIGGLAGAYLDLLFGEGSFEGTVAGSELTLTRYGSRATTSGTCALTLKATVHATLSGDALSGTIKYEPATTTSPDCAQFADCYAIQNFAGTRPPM